jgi:hypothetical protein
MSCINLTSPEFNKLVEPLLFEKLLKKVKDKENQVKTSQYKLTTKGDQFIEFLILGLYYAEDNYHGTPEPEKQNN